MFENPELALIDRTGAKYGGIVLGSGVLFLIISSYTIIPMWLVTSCVCAAMLARDCTVLSTDPAHPAEKRVYQVGVRRMPWEIAPFAFCMFVLVGVLTNLGWTEAFGRILLLISKFGVLGSAVGGIWFTVLTMNCLNNQPATIFMIEALVPLKGALSSSNFAALLVAVILGSNICANFAIAGALAGLMWRSILRAHDIDIPWSTFLSAGIKVMLIPTFVSGGVIFLQSLVL
jgi:Na+/H+ antiporter NhaD/arsenite permease-like protein